MFLRKNASSEIEVAFQETIVKNAADKQTAGLTKLAEAVELVGNAAEIFDSVGMHKEAEVMTIVLESLAAKKKKKKPAAKSKKDDSKLTSEKMVDNLKTKGWVFNADDNAVDDNFVDYANKRRERAEAEKQSPSFWNSKAKEWYQKALDFQKKGEGYQARECFKKADEYLAKAEELEAKHKYRNIADDDNNWVSDNEHWSKDEREMDLAKIMHEIEEANRDEHDFEDEYDVPFRDRRKY